MVPLGLLLNTCIVSLCSSVIRFARFSENLTSLDPEAEVVKIRTRPRFVVDTIVTTI